jgi:AraC family transcriptional regulator
MHVSEHNYPPGMRQAGHAHDVTTISIVLAGGLRERAGRREHHSRPLSIVIKPIGTEHADDFGPQGARLLRITLPDGAERGAPDTQHLAHWRWTDAGPACRPFLQLAHILRYGSTATDEVERRAWDVLALLARSAADDRCGGPPRCLAHARATLDEEEAPPRLTELATRAGVHPLHLAREFRRFYGCSTTDQLQRRRVQRAAALIAAGGMPLARVAIVAGFYDQPHMGRVFRRHTGLPPGAFRCLASDVSIVQDARRRAH